MSHDALILDLSADLAPVRSRSVGREALALAALGALELAMVVGAGLMRPDMSRAIATPAMLWKMGSLMLLAGASCWIAMRSFAPPIASRRGIVLVLALAGLAMIGGLFVTPAADVGRSLATRLAPVHGLICTTAIVVLALPWTALLAALMRRAAPVRPERSAIAAGLAASTSGALVFAFCCPMNDPLYIITWYAIAVALVTALARWLLPRRYRL